MPPPRCKRFTHTIEPAAGAYFNATHEGRQHLRTAHLPVIAESEYSGEGGRPGMQQRGNVEVIEIKGMRSRAVDQRSRCRCGSPPVKHGGPPDGLPVMHRLGKGTRFAICHAREPDGEPVNQRHPGALGYRFWQRRCRDAPIVLGKVPDCRVRSLRRCIDAGCLHGWDNNRSEGSTACNAINRHFIQWTTQHPGSWQDSGDSATRPARDAVCQFMTPTSNFPPPPQQLARAIAYMMAMGAIWGLQISLAKIGSNHQIDPVAWMVFVNGIGAPALLIIAAWRGTDPRVLIPHGRYALIAGITAIAIPNTLVVLVMGYLPAGLAAVLNTLSPLMTYAMALGFKMAPLQGLRIAGLGFGVAGTLMVLLPKTSLPDPAIAPWVLVCLLIPLFYSISNIYIARQRPAGIDSIALAGAMQAGSFVCLLPIALVRGIHIPFPPSHLGDWALLAHAAFSWLGALLFFEVMRLAGPVFFSQTGFLVTLWGVFWGWLFFGESHSVWVWAAMVSIFTGLALVTRASR